VKYNESDFDGWKSAGFLMITVLILL